MSLISQQGPAVPVGRVPDPGQDEEVPAAERLHVVHERLVDQPLLDGLELAPDVLLAGDEDVARLQVAVLVYAQVVVVGARTIRWLAVARVRQRGAGGAPMRFPASGATPAPYDRVSSPPSQRGGGTR
jgi:hypothetical protein